MNKLKNISFIATAFLTFFAASAQQPINPTSKDDNRDQFGFGIKGGVNISNVYDEQGDNFVANNRTGYYGGVFASVPIGGRFFGLQPEILYSQKGFKGRGTFLGESYDFERTTSYLDIPIQLQVKPISCVTILAGPQFSYLLNTKDSFNNGTITVDQKNQFSADNYQKNILGFVVGAELNLKGFLITARGGWDVSKSEKNGLSTTPRYKNQVLSLGLGYTFY